MKRFYRDTWSKVFSVSRKTGLQKVAITIKLSFNTQVILWSALLSVQNKHNLRYIAISHRISFICHTNLTSLDRMEDAIRHVFALAYVSTFFFKLLSRTRANLFNFVRIWWPDMRELQSVTFSIFLRVFHARDFPQPPLSCYFQSSFLHRRSPCTMRMQCVDSRERHIPLLRSSLIYPSAAFLFPWPYGALIFTIDLTVNLTIVNILYEIWVASRDR